MTRQTITWAQVSLYTVILASVGCHQNDVRHVSEPMGPGNGAQAVDQNPMQASPAIISVDEQIKGAKLDLAARLGVGVNAISVKEARSVQWGSGALGCPKPGMNYTQALVPGVRVILEVDGTIYYYHGKKGRSLFNCPAERVTAPAYGQGLEIM